jgi:hypothetical protein
MTIKCSLVLCLRNAATGRALSSGDIRVTLNGAPVKSQFREGGYFVFIGLEAGNYGVELRGVKYKTKALSCEVPKGGFETYIVSLEPSAGLPKGEMVTVSGSECFIPDKGAAFRLTQEAANPGDTSVSVYTKGMVDFPYTFVFGESENAEICTIDELDDGVITLREPLRNVHERGELLRQAAIGLEN